MLARARALAALTSVVGLSLSCAESTTPIDPRGNDLQLPAAGDRDRSKVAGTYVNPYNGTPRLILGGDGGFSLHYTTPWTLEYGGSFVRVDSALVLSFSAPGYLRDYVMSGVVRGDTVIVYDASTAAHTVGFWDLYFVRVRAP